MPSSLGHTDEEEKMDCEGEEGGGGEDTPPNLMSQLHLMLTGAGEKVCAP